LSFFLITLLVPAVGFAQEGKASVRLWGQMSPFMQTQNLNTPFCKRG
jgi:hypothetical protein